MTFGADLAAVLPEMRAHAESRMTSLCEIREPATVTRDRETGEATTVPGELIYDGPCYVRATGSSAVTEQVAGGQDVTTRPYMLRIPASAVAGARVTTGMVATLSVSADPWLVDRPLTVVMNELGDNMTARRITVLDHLERRPDAG